MTSSLIQEQDILEHAHQQGVDTILSGWGGDHCVTHRGAGALWEAFYRRNWSSVATLVAAHKQRFPRYLWGELRHGWRVYSGTYVVRNKKRHANPLFLARTQYLPTILPAGPRLQQMQAWALTDGDIIDRTEAWAQSAMPYGIVYRYPLLDKRLLEFALGLPPDQIVRGQHTRWLVRHAFATIMPPHIAWNLDKSDHIRSQHSRDVLGQAGPQLVQLLRKQQGAMWGEEYVNVPALIAYLESDKFAKVPRLGKVRNALHVLDFA